MSKAIEISSTKFNCLEVGVPSSVQSSTKPRERLCVFKEPVK